MNQEFQPSDQGQEAEPLLAFTENAVARMKEILARHHAPDGGVRMTVAGGGCQGFQYRLTLAEAAHPEDVVVVQDGVTAFLDPFSATHLRGTILDYVSTHDGTGFQFRRLDVARTIGCSSPILLRRCLAGNTRTTGCWNSAKRPLLDLVQEVAPAAEPLRTSVAHPGLRPRTICPQCQYVVCRCDKAA